MRATLFATIGLVACTGLAGCDNPGPAPVTNAQAVAQPCNCQPQNEATAQSATPRTTHRHHRHWTSYARRDYNESESYSYRSQSRNYYQSESDEQERYANQSASGGNAERNVWVDGYGRSHYAMTASAAPAPDERARLAPWHGYDENCDDKK
jgi:hypothetical protein